MTSFIDPALLEILRCPETGARLSAQNGELATADGARRYPVVNGIPVLLPQNAAPTHKGYDRLAAENRAAMESPAFDARQVKKYLNGMLVPTCGNLFRGVTITNDYPIPDFPRVHASGLVLDIGCNWGRWTIAGARAGHRMIGVDIHLKSLLCAQALARGMKLAHQPLFVLADARHLPFAEKSFGGAFSYSVIQHFSREYAARIAAETGRVLMPGAEAIVQMPNVSGLKTMLTQWRRRHSEGGEFDVRYYSIEDLLALFEKAIGPARWSVDCFLGLNVHARDLRFVPCRQKWIVYAAEALAAFGCIVPPFARLSDSVFVTATKSS